MTENISIELAESSEQAGETAKPQKPKIPRIKNPNEVTLTCQVTIEQSQQIEAHAKELGLSRAAYIRYKLFGGSIKDAIKPLGNPNIKDHATRANRIRNGRNPDEVNSTSVLKPTVQTAID